MHRILIENYIKQISKQDIVMFANKNNVNLLKKDVDILYHYLKNYWQELLYGDALKVFTKLEYELGSEKVQIIKKLYEFYYDKYHNLL